MTCVRALLVYMVNVMAIMRLLCQVVSTRHTER